MNELIQDYLRTRGARFFRGHHVDEYFFLVDVLVEGRHKRLNVHLQASGDTVTVLIAPDRYYSATAREALVELAGRWRRGEPDCEVVVHDSSDPSLVGVSIHRHVRPKNAAELRASVDHSVTAAIELFAAMRRLAAPAEQDGPMLRDAG